MVYEWMKDHEYKGRRSDAALEMARQEWKKIYEKMIIEQKISISEIF